MMSREFHLKAMNSSFDSYNYISDFNGIPTVRQSAVTLDLYVCSIFFCDQFSQENLDSYIPRKSYRYQVPYQPLSHEDRLSISSEVRDLFLFGYSNYLDHAFPAPQLDPLTCGRARFPQSDIHYMTLLDTLDTLHVLGLDDEFVDGVIRLKWVDLRAMRCKEWR